jgi:histidyl-tRNA synthetase
MEKIPPVKGTRDFYPDQMALRNWIVDGWRAVSQRNGFVEYDGPIFEYLQLYTQKSGDEIAGQLFSMTDRGGRDLAIRPEITPTLARMVNQQINSLARPIKWFSVPRLCRAERPQKGRLREFFQWNCDIIGSDSVYADADCIYTAIDYLRSVGLGSDDIVVKISSRAMLAELLKHLGFAQEQLDSVYALLDKRAKLPAETFIELAKDKITDEKLRDKLFAMLDKLQPEDDAIGDKLDKIIKYAPDSKHVQQLDGVFYYLGKMAVADYCEFDINIVRGLAYYTGIVFEIFDRKNTLRAICGGGRYDNLLAGLGGQQVPAIGFGMGDVVLEILLSEKNLLGHSQQELDFFVVYDDYKIFEEKGLPLINQLRKRGHSAVFDYRRGAMGKQLKQAATQKATFAVIIGQETKADGNVTVKNMAEGTQQVMKIEELPDRAEQLTGS